MVFRYIIGCSNCQIFYLHVGSRGHVEQHIGLEEEIIRDVEVKKRTHTYRAWRVKVCDCKRKSGDGRKKTNSDGKLSSALITNSRLIEDYWM